MAHPVDRSVLTGVSLLLGGSSTVGRVHHRTGNSEISLAALQTVGNFANVFWKRHYKQSGAYA